MGVLRGPYVGAPAWAETIGLAGFRRLAEPCQLDQVGATVECLFANETAPDKADE